MNAPLHRFEQSSAYGLQLPVSGAGYASSTAMIIAAAICAGASAAAPAGAAVTSVNSPIVWVAAHLRAAYAEMTTYGELKADWDGDGALPVSPIAVKNALGFVVSLPPGINAPMAEVFPEGYVGWSWRGRKASAGVDFYANGEVAYFAKEGKRVARGNYRVAGQSIPVELIDILAQI